MNYFLIKQLIHIRKNTKLHQKFDHSRNALLCRHSKIAYGNRNANLNRDAVRLVSFRSARFD